jgi:hypothetical protein
MSKRKKSAIPRVKKDICWDDLVETCVEYRDGLVDDDRMKDPEYYIYEAAIKAVFGEDFFKWANKHFDGEY